MDKAKLQKVLDILVGLMVLISLCGGWMLATYLIMPPPQYEGREVDRISASNNSILFSMKEQKEMETNLVVQGDLMQGDLSWIGWLVGALFVLFILWQIVKSGYGAILIFGALGLALIGFIFWILLFRGGDVSTAEARDKNLQTIQVVQPVGDPAVDQVYAEINRENAGSNVVNAAGVSIYTVLIWVTVIIFFGIGIFLWYVAHR